MTIISEFKKMLEEPDEDLRVDTLIKTSADKGVYEKWIQIFNTITPFNIPQGLSIIDSSYKMNKRDCVILLAYIKFFEQRLNKMREMGDNDDFNKIFETLSDDNETGKKGNEYDGTMFS
jgi:hypothetical protein